MRNFIDIVSGHLFEARKKSPEDKGSKTDTKTKPTYDLFPDLEAGSKGVAKADGPAGAPALPGKKTTRKVPRTAGVDMNDPGMAAAMHGILNHGMEDEISDEEARANSNWGDDVGEHPIIPTNENLPAIISREISLDGGRIIPEWTQVKDLPGYMLNAIRAVGRALFREYTNTRIEDIQMLATVPGMNSETEVKAMMAWVMKNGVPGQKAKITLYGKEIEVSPWKTDDFSFLLGHDDMGYYVYAWVQKNGIRVGGNDDHKRLASPE